MRMPFSTRQKSDAPSVLKLVRSLPLKSGWKLGSSARQAPAARRERAKMGSFTRGSLAGMDEGRKRVSQVGQWKVGWLDETSRKWDDSTMILTLDAKRRL